jgi:DNA-directed RNA polymerase specialized sigma24 family protein
MVAYRVVGNHEEAVQNCLRTAADNVPRFEHEDTFRCWLARVLIDEAVLLLSKQSVAPPHIEQRDPSKLTGAFSSEVRRISGRGADS